MQVLSIKPRVDIRSDSTTAQKMRSKNQLQTGHAGTPAIFAAIESLACDQEAHHYQCASINRPFSLFMADRMNPLGYAAWGVTALREAGNA
ncbi:hypothetical protein F3J24_01855 [Comamonas sp. Tr-654]|uniref:hypothetical protein n=1 Tax=Comamonas sp. Tr-654 TaxID=2608341 RepID=UPI001420D557|nr:hypothetical protein [Comamonas sp. Tr-654]NIF82257.1 hypothetical protein [Comamonas sp. Tr-654]